MNGPETGRRLVAEAIGTGLLVATVVGSGIMAARLSGDGGIALLTNTLPTGAILFVVISLFGPVSGAHFNPAVTLVLAVQHLIGPRLALAYIGAQIAGGAVGTFLAHAMFDLPLWQIGQIVRSGGAQWLSEGIATFGLVLTVLGTLRTRPQAVAQAVALYIVAAYWFTGSTSFANPAVALARALTESFSGIRPVDVPAFVLAQVTGALTALVLCRWLYRERNLA